MCYMLLCSHATTPSPAVVFGPPSTAPRIMTPCTVLAAAAMAWGTGAAQLRQLHSLEGECAASLRLLAGLALPDANCLPLD